MPSDFSALHPVLANVLSNGCRLLDIFVCRACGLDPLSLPCKDKVLRKLRLYYEEASSTERRIILRTFPELSFLNMPTSNAFSLRISPDETADMHYIPMESFVKLSGASMWGRQNSYYAEHDLAAWTHVVPFEISSNAFIADKYCDAIEAISAAQLKDRIAPTGLVRHATVCVLEIGAGHGILSYLMARHMLARHCADFKFRFICSDFHDGSFLKLLSYPWVQELCSTGCLDFTVLKADLTENSTHPVLLYSKTALQSMKPDLVIVVANYAFDSFPVDLVVKNGPDVPSFKIGVSNASRSRGHKRRKFNADITSSGVASVPVHPPSIMTDNGRGPDSSGGPFAKARRGGQSTAFCCSVVTAGQCALADAVVNSPLPPGAYVLPVSGYELLKAIRHIFDSTDRFAMIVGDYFVCPDSKAWQLNKFEDFAGHVVSGRHCTMAAQPAVRCGWFDPPLISPSSDVCAFPVTLETLFLAFNMAFDSAVVSNPTDRNGSSVLNCEASSLYPSSFSVISMGTKVGDGDKDPIGLSFSKAFQFGPNELAQIRQMLKEDRSVRQSLSSQQWKACFELARFDICFFLDNMWDIRRMLRLEFVDSSEILEWFKIVDDCFRNKAYFTSTCEFCLIRERVVSWLISFKRREGFTAARMLFLRTSYSFYTEEPSGAKSANAYDIKTIIDVLLCHYSASFDLPQPEFLCQLLQHLVGEVSDAPTVADLSDLIRQDPILSSNRRHWLCSLTTRRKALARAIKTIKKIAKN